MKTLICIDNWKYFKFKQLATEQAMFTSTSSLAVQSRLVWVQLSIKVRNEITNQTSKSKTILTIFNSNMEQSVCLQFLVCPSIFYPRFRPLLAILSQKRVKMLKFQTCWTCRISRSMVQSHHETNISESYHNINRK